MTDLKFSPETIETIPIADLKPYERNPRTHSKEQVAKIAASMLEFGWTVPVMIDDANEVIAGHGRLLAAETLGIAAVPAIRMRHLSPEQVKALRIADNQTTILGDWDIPILSVEIHGLNAAGFSLDVLGFDLPTLDSLIGPVGDDTANAGESVTTTLAERFGIPPFSVLNAREGWWQDRKRAWIALGIQSELGRGSGVTWGDSAEITEPGLNYYRNKNATPGGH